MKCRECEYYQFARRDSVFPKGVHYCEKLEDLVKVPSYNRIKFLASYQNRKEICNDKYFEPKEGKR